MKNPLNSQRAFTITEVVIALGIFALIVPPIYFAYTNILLAIQKNQWRQEELAVIQNEMETIRNMSYSDIGVNGGYPPGLIPSNQNINYLGDNFMVTTTVRNVDDPLDGLTPEDTAPADYKLVEATALCVSCGDASPLTITSTFAPHALETASNNGSLFINIFDANGQSIPLANVYVTNNLLNPNISITDTTNLNGQLQLVDIPTSTNGYHISVSKSGYSSEQTYTPGAPSNPNPVNPNSTVAKGQLTQMSFAIDKTSTINISTADQFCSPVASVPFTIKGAKLIGTNPDILKYSANVSTDADGINQLNNLEWDTYDFSLNGDQYDLGGSSSLMPLIVNPSAIYSMQWLVTPHTASSLLLTVQDASSTNVNDASVTLSNATYDQRFFSGHRALTQSNWTGNQYSSQSGNIDSSINNQITLLSIDSQYSTSSEWLISNTFDLGTPNTTFYSFDFAPASQPPQTNLKFQLATNNDNATWNFWGPDGTAGTYYTTSSQAINAVHNNNRYLRYKVYLQTSDPNLTPVLNSVSLDFSSSCIPQGQVFFGGLQTGTYTLNIQKGGYQTYTDNAVIISNGWQNYTTNINHL